MVEYLGFSADIDYEKNKKIILERLREHVLTNLPYAKSMMTKLNAEEALPRNLGASLIVVLGLAIYAKAFGWITQEWKLLVGLLPIWIVIEIMLFLVAEYRFRRTIKRTVQWCQELQEKREHNSDA